MEPTEANLKAEHRAPQAFTLIGILGCALAIAGGAAAASHGGMLTAAAIAGLATCAAAIALYIRDPVLVFILLWLCVVFDPTLSAMAGYLTPAGAAIRQAFEIPVALFIVLTIWRTIRMNTRLPSLGLILPGIGVGFFGVLGALLHGVPASVAVLGAWLGLKLWTMVAVTLLLPWRRRDIERVYTALTVVGCLVAILGIVDLLSGNAVSDALHTSGHGVGLGRSDSVNSILVTPGAFSLFMSMLFALTYSRFALEHGKADLMLALLFAASAVLSLRLKGFLSLGAVVLIVAAGQSALMNRRSILPVLVGVLLLAGAYSFEGRILETQIAKYTSGDNPRAVLYETGVAIARDEFPVGAGFGRFGSYPSQLSYSPVYDQYGVSTLYGLSRSYPEAILDASWASILGETGIGGLVFYAVGLLILVGSVLRQAGRVPNDLRWVPLSTLCMIGVLLVTSAGQGSLFDWLAVTTIALMVGLTLVATATETAKGSATVSPARAGRPTARE